MPTGAFINRHFSQILALLTIVLSILGWSYTYITHRDDKEVHFANGEKKEYRTYMAKAPDHYLSATEKGAIINHMDNKDVHMSLEKKLELFYTRTEALQLRIVIEDLKNDIDRLNTKIDNLRK